MSTTIYSSGGGGGGSSSTIITCPSSTTMATTGTYVPATGTVGIVGGGGGSGSVWTTTGTGPQWSPYTVNTPNTTTFTITGKNPVIKTDKSEINLDEVADLVKIMKERLLILIPDFEKHEKYAALKKAYDHYKLIEAMVQEETK